MIVVANWKMFHTPSQAEMLSKSLVSTLSPKLSQVTNDSQACEVVICPPYVSLERVKTILSPADSSIRLGAQDLHWEEQSARTGKVSADMLADLGVAYVILGHSEQREYFHENNSSVNKKIKAALSNNIKAIICVGESIEQREMGKVNDIINKQILECFLGISKEEAIKCLIAYEPLWAIGTAKAATSSEVQEVHAYIRSVLSDLYDHETATKIQILYGGSVKEENAADLALIRDVDGFLVGGASLVAEKFKAIIMAVLSSPA